MKLAAYNRFCGALPHAAHVVQWGGAHVWKVGGLDGGKVFGIAGWNRGEELAVTFKCTPFQYDLLVQLRGCRPAPYLASRGMTWIQRVDADPSPMRACASVCARATRWPPRRFRRRRSARWACYRHRDPSGGGRARRPEVTGVRSRLASAYVSRRQSRQCRQWRLTLRACGTGRDRTANRASVISSGQAITRAPTDRCGRRRDVAHYFALFSASRR